MPLPKSVKRNTIIKLIVTVLAFILVLVFAPRLDGPRIINGIEFNTKSGGPGLTNFGWILLVVIPVLTYIITDIILRMSNKNK